MTNQCWRLTHAHHGAPQHCLDLLCGPGGGFLAALCSDDREAGDVVHGCAAAVPCLLAANRCPVPQAVHAQSPPWRAAR